MFLSKRLLPQISLELENYKTLMKIVFISIQKIMEDIFGYVQYAIILVIKDLKTLYLCKLIVKGLKVIAFENLKIWMKNIKLLYPKAMVFKIDS